MDQTDTPKSRRFVLDRCIDRDGYICSDGSFCDELDIVNGAVFLHKHPSGTVEALDVPESQRESLRREDTRWRFLAEERRIQLMERARNLEGRSLDETCTLAFSSDDSLGRALGRIFSESPLLDTKSESMIRSIPSSSE